MSLAAVAVRNQRKKKTAGAPTPPAVGARNHNRTSSGSAAGSIAGRKYVAANGDLASVSRAIEDPRSGSSLAGGSSSSRRASLLLASHYLPSENHNASTEVRSCCCCCRCFFLVELSSFVWRKKVVKSRLTALATHVV